MINLKKVDLNLFLVFDVIYREGSITGAARNLNLTQPAVSHSLSRLRQLFEDPLFVRQGNRMVATPLAGQLAAKVRDLLSQVDRLLEHPNTFEPARSERNFSIAMRDVLEATLLPPLLQSIQSQAPDISLQSLRVNRRDLSKKLAQGDIDLFIDVSLPVDKDIHQQKLFRDQLVVMCAQDHPCLERKWTLKSYLQQSHIVVSSRNEGPSVEDIELSKHDHHRKIQMRNQHYYAASRVVANSQLLLTMPRAYAEILSQGAGLTLLDFPFKVAAVEIFIYWHQRLQEDPAHQWLRQKLEDTAHQI